VWLVLQFWICGGICCFAGRDCAALVVSSSVNLHARIELRATSHGIEYFSQRRRSSVAERALQQGMASADRVFCSGAGTLNYSLTERLFALYAATGRGGELRVVSIHHAAMARQNAGVRSM